MPESPLRGSDRERAVSQAFVSIANALVSDCDTVDLHTLLTDLSANLLDVSSAGLLLADADGVLRLAAASTEHTRNLELFLLQCDQGPCLDCFRDGVTISVADLSTEEARWPAFVPTALEAGFRSVYALPMHLGGTRLGTLGLFSYTARVLNDADLELGQAMADVASMALVATRNALEHVRLNEQLQTALESRVVVEQAKGLLAQLGSVTMDGAFDALRRYARDHNERLSEVARRVVSHELPGNQVFEHAQKKGVHHR
jgi:hypothetical protein